MKRDFPQRQESQGFGTAQSQSEVGQERTQFVPPPPSMGQGNQFQSQGAIQAPSSAQMGQRGQSVGRSQVQSPQARMSRTQGCVCAVVPEAEHANQPDMQGSFYTCNYFCIMFIIIASCVIGLGFRG